MQQNKTARSWTFTSFADNINIDPSKVKYAIYQREVCPETGREHWQGYFTAHGAVRLTGAKAIIGDNTAHMEIAKGNAEQNHKYCTKDECRKEGTMPTEIGTLAKMGQGKRYVDMSQCHMSQSGG